MLETLRALCALPGVSGCEDAVRAYIEERARPFADEMLTDAMGNLLVFRKGRAAGGRHAMLCAHMDEVGVIILSASEDGTLKFGFVGSVDRRVALAKRVHIGKTPGVIGLKAHHLVSREEEKTVPKADALYIDIGAADEKSALDLIAPGDCGVFESEFVEFGEGFIKARAIDDRAGCAALLKLLEIEPPADTWFAFTVQEEVGARGARTAAWRLEPSYCLVLEGTTAADLPGVPEEKRICRLGGGVVIPFMDGGTLYDRGLYALAASVAGKNGIAWQTKNRIAGGTDAAAIQRSRAGVRTLALSVAVRNIHSPACVAARADLEALPQLARLVMEEMTHDAG
jgi:putative aminopeptidase FrvX